MQAKTMFSCSIGQNPNPFIEQQISLSDQQNLPCYSSNFADPLFEDDDLFLNYLLTHHHLLAGSTSLEDPTEISIEASNIEADANNESNDDTEFEREISGKLSSKRKGEVVKPTLPRKRRGKKDRHSKICTAQGTRDRRMRLSLPVARKFFDLHDMLGFDKASKTIEWLFSKSKEAIKELEKNMSKMKQYTLIAAKSLSSTTESEVVSWTGEAAESGDFNKFSGCPKEKKRRKLLSVAKESRDMARARARERTREKMNMALMTIPGGDEEASNHGFLEHQINSVNINEIDFHCLLSPSALKISRDEGSTHEGNNGDEFFRSFTRNCATEFQNMDMQPPHCIVPQMKALLVAANDNGPIPNEVINHFKLQTRQGYLPF